MNPRNLVLWLAIAACLNAGVLPTHAQESPTPALEPLPELIPLAPPAGTVPNQHVAPPRVEFEPFAPPAGPGPLVAPFPPAMDAPVEVACAPPWVFSVEAVFLDRSTNNRTLYSDTLISSQGIRVPDFSHETGIRLGLVWPTDCCVAWELRYLWLNGWSGGAADIGTPGRYARNDLYGFPDTLVDLVGVSYSSNYRDLEINRITYQTAGWDVLLGLRYINLEESLAVSDGTFPGVDFQDAFTTQTDNDLLGVQVGTAIDLCCSSHACCDLTLKAGVFWSDHGEDSTHTPSDARFVDSNQDIAFVIDGALAGDYWLSNWLKLFGGYQVIWISDVAEAAGQVNSTDLLSATPSGRVTRSDVVIHGAFVGLEALY